MGNHFLFSKIKFGQGNTCGARSASGVLNEGSLGFGPIGGFVSDPGFRVPGSGQWKLRLPDLVGTVFHRYVFPAPCLEQGHLHHKEAIPK
jgi:hypothetical protein